MKAPEEPPSPPGTRTGHRIAARVIAGLSVLGIAAAAWIYARLPPVPPIPAPADLARLDPQVRDHLHRVALRAAEAPRSAERRAELGLAFAANNLWSDARTCFLDAIRLGDASPLPPTYAAAALIEAGQTAAAAEELRAVVARHPGFAPAWQRLGAVLVQTGQFADAMICYSNLTQMAPREWRGWAGLGEVAVRTGKPAEAIAPLERARALAPFARPVHHLLSIAYRSAGRHADANREAAAGQSQSVGPMDDPWSELALDHMKSVSDQLSRADLLLARGDAEGAIRRLQETLRHHPTNLLVVCRTAAAFNGADQSRLAWRLLEPHLARVTNDAALLIMATHTTAALGQTNEALELAARAIALSPRSAESHVARADALVAAGRDTEAAEALQQALEFAPGNVHLLVQLGDLLWRNLDRPADALATFQRANVADPIDLLPLDRLAQLKTERRDFLEADRAIAELRRLQADPGLVQTLEQALAKARAQP